MKPKVRVDKHGYALEEDLARLAQVVDVVEPEEQLSEAGLIEALTGCAGLIRLGDRIPDLTRAVFAGAPGGRMGSGVDAVVSAQWGSGVPADDGGAGAVGGCG